TMFAIDVFVSDDCDPSGSGEGAIYLRTKSFTTNGLGRGRTEFPNLSAVPGQFITATATSPGGDTSEFSLCRLVTSSAGPGGGGGEAGSLPVAVTADLRGPRGDDGTGPIVEAFGGLILGRKWLDMPFTTATNASRADRLAAGGPDVKPCSSERED